VEDKRKSYGETRILCFGALHGRVVVIGYTPRAGLNVRLVVRKAAQVRSPS